MSQGYPAIRPAQPEDASALAAIARAAYAPYLPRLGFEPPPMQQDFPADIAVGAVWTAGEPPVGYIVARPSGEDWLIENLARDPSGHRGLGRALLAHAEDEGRRRGCARAVLYTNEVMTEAAALYPRLGYVETDRTETNGLLRIHFAKPLD